MSDSHGDKETVKAVSKLAADAHIHCGDSELTFEDIAFGDMYKVRGNCDFDKNFPTETIIAVGRKKILVVHGHLHNVHNSLMDLYYSAKENDVDIVLFGHTHLFGAEMKDRILFVNPGSTMLPRGGKEPTYAVIEWDKHMQVTFKNMKNEVVQSIELNSF